MITFLFFIALFFNPIFGAAHHVIHLTIPLHFSQWSARTGLTGLIINFLFFIALFFIPRFAAAHQL